MKKLLIVVVVIIVSASASGFAQPLLTLDAAVNSALTDNRELAAARMRVEAKIGGEPAYDAVTYQRWI